MAEDLDVNLLSRRPLRLYRQAGSSLPQRQAPRIDVLLGSVVVAAKVKVGSGVAVRNEEWTIRLIRTAAASIAVWRSRTHSRPP